MLSVRGWFLSARAAGPVEADAAAAGLKGALTAAPAGAFIAAKKAAPFIFGGFVRVEQPRRD